MTHPLHSGHPKSIKAGCPVPPQKGRDVFQHEEHQIPFIRLTWEGMKRSCHFAFFQCANNGWRKGETQKHLNHCGLPDEVAIELCEAAERCKASKEQHTMDCKRREGIGAFSFPPAWPTQDTEVKDCVEGTMHLLHLGMAKSINELAMSFWSGVKMATKF